MQLHMLLIDKYVIKKESVREFFINLLTVTFIMLAMILELKIDSILPITESMVLLSGALVVLVIFFNQYRYSIYKINKSIFLIITILFFILLNSIFVRNYILIGAIFNLITGATIAYQLVRNKNSEYLYLIPFWFIVIYILIRLSINLDPNEVFIRSRNYISFFLIIAVVPYYYLNFKNSKSSSVIPILIVLILSIYSLSRSGSVSAFILFCGVILSKNLNKTVLTIFLTLFIVFIIIFLSYLTANYEGAAEFSRLFSFLDTLQNGARVTILRNYIEEMDFVGFLIGIDTNTPKILDFGGSYLPGHVHSSILNFISVVGVSFLLYCYYVLKTIRFLFKNNMPMMLFFVAIFLRMATDIGLLFSYFDYVVWVFIMTMFFSEKEAFLKIKKIYK